MPLPALWTAVLGEYNRYKESGHERRISIEKIITHSHYSHFDHDIGKYCHDIFSCIDFCSDSIHEFTYFFRLFFYFVSIVSYFFFFSLFFSVLLKLAETIKLDNFINKICLPIQNHFTYLLDEHFFYNVIEDRKFTVNK